MSEQPTNTPLAALLRACSPEQRQTLATRAGTSVNYLYSLAGCHRERVSAGLALAIEDASRELNEENKGLTPIVTTRELATMCALTGFDNLTAE